MSTREEASMQPAIKLKPLISYPREARVGETYLLTIDVQLDAPGAPWPYPEEEYAISFVLDARPFFTYEPLTGEEEPSVILHRFGGTYGPAEYLLTAASEEVEPGYINITFLNGWGLEIASMKLECAVKQELQAEGGRKVTIARKERHATPQSPTAHKAGMGELSGEPATTTPDAEVRQPEFILLALIEEKLVEAGWQTLHVGKITSDTQLHGVAVRGEPALHDRYLLFLNEELAGMVLARPVGEPLAGTEEAFSSFEAQTMLGWALYNREGRFTRRVLESTGRTPSYPVLPFVYESTGRETRFTNYLEPEPRSRGVFTFHRPETLASWLKLAPPDVPPNRNDLLRSRLRHMPPLPLATLQAEMVSSLERSLATNHPRTLMHMATGTGKTQALVSCMYRLLKFGNAQRILYLADHTVLIQQMHERLERYSLPDEPTPARFTELYQVQYLHGDAIDPGARVCIATVHEFYLALIRPTLQQRSREPAAIDQVFQTLPPLQQQAVASELVKQLAEIGIDRLQYNAEIPIESFDVIILDDYAQSSDLQYRHLFEYFDAFIIGVASTANSLANWLFHNNLVYEQSLSTLSAEKPDSSPQQPRSDSPQIRRPGEKVIKRPPASPATRNPSSPKTPATLWPASICVQVAHGLGIELERASDTRKLKVYTHVLKYIFDVLMIPNLDELPLDSLQQLANGLSETIQFFYSIQAGKLGERFDRSSITSIIQELDKASEYLSHALSLLKIFEISKNSTNPKPMSRIFFKDIHTSRASLSSVISLLEAL